MYLCKYSLCGCMCVYLCVVYIGGCSSIFWKTRGWLGMASGVFLFHFVLLLWGRVSPRTWSSLFFFFPRSGLKTGKAQWPSCPYLPQCWFTRLYGTTPGWLLLGLTLQRAVHMSRNSSLGSALTGLWDCWWILEAFLRNLENGFLSAWKSHFPVLFLSLVDEASCSLLTHTKANAHVQTPQICIHLYLLHVFQPLLASWSFLSPPPINYVF